MEPARRRTLIKHHLPHVALHVALLVGLIVALVTGPLSLFELSQQPQAPRSPVRVVDAHLCDKHDFATGCALPQATVREISRGVDPTAQGVDFGWPGASCSALSQAQQFGVSYLSYDTSKDWTRSCLDAFHRAGKKTVAVFEAGQFNPLGGCSQGATDARHAAAELSALGAPPGQPFTMAIDFDATGSQLATVGSYFHCAGQAEPGRVNAYGGYDQIQYLYQHGVVGHLNWQTYAWSGGRWLPASIAPLEQYLNSSAVDYDRAIASNYGQWPYGSPKPAPKPRVLCWGKGSTPTSTACKAIRAQSARDWAQYQSFHNGEVAHQKQEAPVQGRINALGQVKNPISVPGYKGPGLGYLARQVKASTYWADHFRALHDNLVKEHRA